MLAVNKKPIGWDAQLEFRKTTRGGLSGNVISGGGFIPGRYFSRGNFRSERNVPGRSRQGKCSGKIFRRNFSWGYFFPGNVLGMSEKVAWDMLEKSHSYATDIFLSCRKEVTS